MKILPELVHSLKSVQAWVSEPQCVAVQPCDDLTEVNSQLVIISTYLSTGKKRTLDEWKSYIKNPERNCSGAWKRTQEEHHVLFAGLLV
jgi:hypothetical protein